MADECFNVATRCASITSSIFFLPCCDFKTTSANMQSSNEDQTRDIGDIFKERGKLKRSCTEPVK